MSEFDAITYDAPKAEHEVSDVACSEMRDLRLLPYQ